MTTSAQQAASHEKLAHRLVQILRLLNEGERLVPKKLAEHFNVNLRTIQRDIARFDSLRLRKVDGGYELDQHRLGTLSLHDVEQFATLAGIGALFPVLGQNLKRALEPSSHQALLIKGHAYEDIGERRREFEQVEQAIVEGHKVSFRLTGGPPGKIYGDVEPYRMLNLKGIWYLVARHGGRTKTFSFTKISGFLVSKDRFERDPAISKRVEDEDGVWFQDDARDVVLEIDAPVARFFLRRKLVANQVSIQERENGSLLLKARIGHENQVLPIVRYWIPHVRIAEPAEMQKKLEEALLNYVNHKLDPESVGDSFACCERGAASSEYKEKTSW